MFFQPIFLVSKHPIEWNTCLEVVATYLEASAIQIHHVSQTSACLELLSLDYPHESTDWKAIASMLEQDFMTAMHVVIGKPEYEHSSWEQQQRLMPLASSIHQQVITFEQVIVERSVFVSSEQIQQVLVPVIQQLTHEDVETVRAICVTNLNLSQAAKHLFIHRNTLNYRIEKIMQRTGIDPRSFYGSMTLYLASNLKY